MDPQSYYDQIEDYLQAALSPDDHAAFETAMEQDPELARQVALERALIKTLEEENLRQFRAKVRQSLEDSKKKNRPKPGLRPAFLVLSIAATFLLAIAAIWWWNTSSPSLSAAELADNFLAHNDPGILPLDLARRSEQDSLAAALIARVAPEWEKLDSLYRTSDFQGAMDQLLTLRMLDPDQRIMVQNTLQYYTGMCQLHLGETEKALANLAQVQSPYLEKATFFRAIALVKLNREEETEPLLKSIVNASKHPFKEEARRMLKKI